MPSRPALITFVLLLAGGAFVSPAFAEKELLTQAKEAGYPAKSCQYCHQNKLPKKETFKPDDMNASISVGMTPKWKTYSSC